MKQVILLRYCSREGIQVFPQCISSVLFFLVCWGYRVSQQTQEHKNTFKSKHYLWPTIHVFKSRLFLCKMIFSVQKTGMSFDPGRNCNLSQWFVGRPKHPLWYCSAPDWKSNPCMSVFFMNTDEIHNTIKRFNFGETFFANFSFFKFLLAL